jgi:hypothetical protein
MAANALTIKLAGVALAVLAHGAFFYALAAAQPQPYAYGDRYAHAAHEPAGSSSRCALA